MRADLGVAESGLRASSTAPSRCCDLIAFFTAGEDKPAQSWHLRQGLSAWHAAGEIHSDIQRGFVRAEVVGWRRSWRPAATPARASAARCASRAATTSCATAT
jgi:ribosome-binding ATPase YchF (GTP1/OBG family)